jgi:hypothetical protein
VTSELMLDLFARYVLEPGERIESTRVWPGGSAVAVHTDARSFRIRPNSGLLLREAPWVEAVVLARRVDLEIGGRPETHAVVAEVGGGAVYLNDAGQVAELGPRVHRDLDPRAYAEVLVEYHPWSRAWPTLILDRAQLRSQFGHPELPDAEPPSVRPTQTGLELSFLSAAVSAPQYAKGDLTVYAWTVDVPRDAPARWRRRPMLEGVSLEPAQR